MRLRERFRRDVEIPASSTADIAFMLIIFFMITTVFAVTKGVDFRQDPGEEDAQELSGEESIHIRITAGNGLLLHDRPVLLQDLLTSIAPALRANSKKPVIVQSDHDAHYASLIDVLDELRQAPEKVGVEIANISIPTDDDRELMGRVLGGL